MSFYDQIRKREQVTEKGEKDLSREFQGFEVDLWGLVEGGLSLLAISQLGKLLFSASNMRKVNSLLKGIAGLWQRRKVTGLIIGTIDALDRANAEYFKQIGAVPDSVENAARKRLLLLYGYDVDGEKIVSGSWLDRLSPVEYLAREIGQKMNQALLSQMSLKDARAMLRVFIAGRPGQPGLVRRYFGQVTFDLFQQFDRTAQLEYARRLGLEFGIYSGTVIETTRPFCEARNNNIYDAKTIDSWNAINWKGKIPGTDVKVTCGGYNCRHHFSWVSAEIAEVVAGQRGGMNKYNPA